jgi:hypothetical protein
MSLKDEVSLKTGVAGVAHQFALLPFDSAKLRGLSQRLIDSHGSNDDGGSVRALNPINERSSAALDEADMQAFVYNDSTRDHARANRLRPSMERVVGEFDH